MSEGGKMVPFIITFDLDFQGHELKLNMYIKCENIKI